MALVASILVTWAQDPADIDQLKRELEERLAEAFPHASKPYRVNMAERLAHTIITRSPSPERRAEARKEALDDIRGVMLATRTSRKRVDGLREKTQGKVEIPELPQGPYDRELEVIAGYSEATIRESLKYDRPSDTDLATMQAQVDYLIRETRGILAMKLMGPYVQENLDQVTEHIRESLTPAASKFCQPVNRPFTSAELNQFLDAVRKHAHDMPVVNVDLRKSESRPRKIHPKIEVPGPHPKDDILRGFTVLVEAINEVTLPESLKYWKARFEFMADLDAWEFRVTEEAYQQYDALENTRLYEEWRKRRAAQDSTARAEGSSKNSDRAPVGDARGAPAWSFPNSTGLRWLWALGLILLTALGIWYLTHKFRNKRT